MSRCMNCGKEISGCGNICDIKCYRLADISSQRYFFKQNQTDALTNKKILHKEYGIKVKFSKAIVKAVMDQLREANTIIPLSQIRSPPKRTRIRR